MSSIAANEISPPNSIANFIRSKILPYSLLGFPAGFFLFPHAQGHNLYFYLLILLPTLILLCLQPKKSLRGNISPLLFAVIAYLLYTLISMSWNVLPNEEGIFKYAKRVLFILVFVLAFVEVAKVNIAANFETKVFTLSAIAAMLAASYSIIDFYFIQDHSLSTRLTGYGRSSHSITACYAYGAVLLAMISPFFNRNGAYPYNKVLATATILSCVLFIYFTYSRGPIIAMVATLGICGICANFNKKWLIPIAVMLAGTALYLFFTNHQLIARGTSLRLEIWQGFYPLLLENPWFGLGYSEIPKVQLLKGSFHPHNLYIGCLAIGGLAGLGLMLHIVAQFVREEIRLRGLILTPGIAIIVFILLAGLTDIDTLITRPNEIWMAFWLPIALTIQNNIARS